MISCAKRSSSLARGSHYKATHSGGAGLKLALPRGRASVGIAPATRASTSRSAGVTVARALLKAASRAKGA